jgi:hypothetical protein
MKKLSRTQMAINSYLRDKNEKPVVAGPTLKNPDSIKYVDEKKFLSVVTDFTPIDPEDAKSIRKYVNESPKANRHFFNFVSKKDKKSFKELVTNMTNETTNSKNKRS